MRKGLMILAFVVLLVTLLGAVAVLYGMNTLTPEVVQVVSSVIPADQAQDTFYSALDACSSGLFGGRIFGDPLAYDAQQCSFVTYTVRLHNRGFFPAEWIALQASSVQGDLLELPGGGANVLPAGAQGDLSVTVLTSLEKPLAHRAIEVTCYVFGRKQTMLVQTD